MTTTEFDQARTAQATAADDIETQAILLAALTETMAREKDALALLEAQLRVRAPLTGKNAEDREAEFMVRLHSSTEWLEQRRVVGEAGANVDTQRAALERVRMRRQEWLWVMRMNAMVAGPVDEL